MSSAFPWQLARSKRERRREWREGKEGEAEGALLPKAASSQQQQPTPVGRHRKGGGGESVCLCGPVHVCLCGDGGWGVRGAVKALIYVCTLRYSSIPACCCRARGPSGPVLGESLHHIPFPLFQASLYEQHHPQIRLAFPLSPDVLCFHPGHYFGAISCCCRGERRWCVIRHQ